MAKGFAPAPPPTVSASVKKFKHTILEELKNLDDPIITIDAMGTQTKIADQIIRNGGDYILALKGNQGNLHKGVKTFFEQAITQNWSGIKVSYSETTEAGHHRIEHRQVWVVPLNQTVLALL